MINFEDLDFLEKNITVDVILDSVSDDVRLTTFCIRAPRIILPELNTHRVFSRNVSSSRAKAPSVTLKQVYENPFVPHIWTAKHRKMQGTKLLSPFRSSLATFVWKCMAKNAAFGTYLLDKIGVHKQYANRGIEPYMYVDYLVSSTDWDNFLWQRDDYAAQPEIQVVARRVRKALKISEPNELAIGEWHLPYITEYEKSLNFIEDLVRVSAARCARTSYGKPHHTFEADFNLFNNELVSTPPHLSPLEHQAVVERRPPLYSNSNFDLPWKQFRKYYEEERDISNTLSSVIIDTEDSLYNYQ